MRRFRNDNEREWKKDLASFLLGAIGGLATGILLSRLIPRIRSAAGRRKATTSLVPSRVKPARLHRAGPDQPDLDRLEEAVFSGLMADGVFRERGIDVGVAGPGIIELSGSVWTEDEADRAVSLANRISGVLTVVNRLDVEELARRAAFRRRLTGTETSSTFSHFEGRVGGMGRRRQGSATERPRRDDSQRLREGSLAAADRTQWSDEGLMDIRKADSRSANPTRFPEGELDNQDPQVTRLRETPGTTQLSANSDRSGRGPRSGSELRLEPSDRSDDSYQEPTPRDRKD
jgi:hypothetical protein